MRRFFGKGILVLVILLVVCIAPLKGEGNQEKAGEVCQQIMEIDFSVREYPFDFEKYDENTDKAYKRAFYRTLTNQVPLEYDEKWGAIYYRDNLRFTQDMTDLQRSSIQFQQFRSRGIKRNPFCI